VIDILNLVVKQCILNRSRGYWLLLDAMFGAISIIVRKLGIEYVKRTTFVPPLVCGTVDSELEIL
jgi:hypothetical protein